MNSNKFTVDRIDEGIVVLLKKPLEVEQLLVPLEKIDIEVTEGDILLVTTKTDDSGYDITLLEEETSLSKNKINNLIEKLKNKNS